MARPQSSVFELQAGVQSYDWGVLGSSSKVAQYAKGSPDFSVDESKPYAEVSSPTFSLGCW